MRNFVIRIIVNGLASVEHLVEEIGRPELRRTIPNDISTVGGLVQSQLDRVAAAGDRTTWQGLSLEVVDLDGKRIGHVLVTTPGKPTK